jgi:hypothetical protein
MVRLPLRRVEKKVPHGTMRGVGFRPLPFIGSVSDGKAAQSPVGQGRTEQMIVDASSDATHAPIAGFLSSLEAFVDPFAGSLQKSSREVPNSLCAGMAYLSAASGQILDDFFRDLSRRPLKVPQRALNSRGCDGRCLSGSGGSEAGGHGDLLRGPKEGAASDVPGEVEPGSGRERAFLRP